MSSFASKWTKKLSSSVASLTSSPSPLPPADVQLKMSVIKTKMSPAEHVVLPTPGRSPTPTSDSDAEIYTLATDSREEFEREEEERFRAVNEVTRRNSLPPVHEAYDLTKDNPFISGAFDSLAHSQPTADSQTDIELKPMPMASSSMEDSAIHVLDSDTHVETAHSHSDSGTCKCELTKSITKSKSEGSALHPSYSVPSLVSSAGSGLPSPSGRRLRVERSSGSGMPLPVIGSDTHTAAKSAKSASSSSLRSKRLPLEWRTIVFIRHGESLWNESTDSALTNPLAAARAMGKGVREYATWKWRSAEYKHEDSEIVDTPLSETGMRQAYKLSQFLKAHMDLRLHQANSTLVQQQMVASPLKDAFRFLQEYAVSEKKGKGKVVVKVKKMPLKSDTFEDVKDDANCEGASLLPSPLKPIRQSSLSLLSGDESDSLPPLLKSAMGSLDTALIRLNLLMTASMPCAHRKIASATGIGTAVITSHSPMTDASLLFGAATSGGLSSALADEYSAIYGKLPIRNDLPLDISYILDILCGTNEETTAVACSNLRRAISTCVLGMWPRFQKTKARNEKVFVHSSLQEMGVNLDTHTHTKEYEVPSVSKFERRHMNIDADALSEFYEKRLETIFNFGPKEGMEDESEMKRRLEVFAKWVFMTGRISSHRTALKLKRAESITTALRDEDSKQTASTSATDTTTTTTTASSIEITTTTTATVSLTAPVALDTDKSASGSQTQSPSASVHSSASGIGTMDSSSIKEATDGSAMIRAAMSFERMSKSSDATSESDGVSVSDGHGTAALGHDEETSETMTEVQTTEAQSVDSSSMSCLPVADTSAAVSGSRHRRTLSSKVYFKCPPSTFIVVGHSAWLRHFFNKYLPKGSSPSACTKRKLSNCGVVAFRFCWDPNSRKFFIAPQTVTVVYGGFGVVDT